MARDHARVNIAIWGSTEFRALSPRAQHLYFVLVTSATLTYAGVADWRPKRLAALAGGWTVEDIEAAAAELAEARTVIIDGDTEEALVRTWIKHDGLLNQERMAVSVANAYGSTASTVLRGVIVHELRKLKESHPELRGWKKGQLLDVLREEPVDPAAVLVYGQTEVGLGANQSSDKASPRNSDLGQIELQLGPNQTSPTPAPTPATSPSSVLHTPRSGSPHAYPEEFETFWKTYPKKADKPVALKAWMNAIERTDPHEILEGARRYRDDPNRESRFTKNASTWLNADAWENEPLPACRSTSVNPAEQRVADQRQIIARLAAMDEANQRMEVS